MKKLLISVFFIFILTGCMMEPYHMAMEKDSGPYPDQYLDIINGFLADYLENPETIANLTVIKPPEKKVIEHDLESVSLAEGNEVWETFITFDAKNRNGKIVRDFHVVWLRNNRIMAFDYKKPDLAYRFEHRFETESEAEAGAGPEKPATE